MLREAEAEGRGGGDRLEADGRKGSSRDPKPEGHHEHPNGMGRAQRGQSVGAHLPYPQAIDQDRHEIEQAPQTKRQAEPKKSSRG